MPDTEDKDPGLRKTASLALAGIFLVDVSMPGGWPAVTQS
jgi:hypothetical protein